MVLGGASLGVGKTTITHLPRHALLVSLDWAVTACARLPLAMPTWLPQEVALTSAADLPMPYALVERHEPRRQEIGRLSLALLGDLGNR